MTNPQRVVLFVDYENMHQCAAEAFEVKSGHFSPWQLGEALVKRRNKDSRTAESHLHEVRVYRGLPDARWQAKSNARNNRQMEAWLAEAPDGRLLVRRRPLRYPAGWIEAKKKGKKSYERPQEKGVDIWLAVDLVQMTYQGGYDVGIVCSHDSDLVPALDAVRSISTSAWHLEVASWARRERIGFTADPNRPWCHRLNYGLFEKVAEGKPQPTRRSRFHRRHAAE